jgi:hypothetical protein
MHQNWISPYENFTHDLTFFLATDYFSSFLMWSGIFSHVSTSLDTSEVFYDWGGNSLDEACLSVDQMSSTLAH